MKNVPNASLSSAKAVSLSVGILREIPAPVRAHARSTAKRFNLLKDAHVDVEYICIPGRFRRISRHYTIHQIFEASPTPEHRLSDRWRELERLERGNKK